MKKGTVIVLKKKYYDGFTVHDILNKHLDDGQQILELLTAFADADGVDAVEVIRCKDCKYYRDGDCWHEREDDRWIYYQSVINEPNPDDYCSLAERREE